LFESLALPGYESKDTYALFREILSTAFIQSKRVGANPIDVKFLTEGCDISAGHAELTNVDVEFFKAIFCFTKLLGLLGWTPQALDQAIRASGGSIDEACMRNIAYASRVRDLLNADSDEAMTICFGHYSDHYFEASAPNPADRHQVRRRLG